MNSEYKGDFPRELSPKGVVLKRADDLVMCINKQKKRLEVSFQVGLEPDSKRDYKTKFYDKIYYCPLKLLRFAYTHIHASEVEKFRADFL